MEKVRMRVRTVTVLVLVVVMSFYGLTAAKAAEIKKYKEFRDRQALWREPNPELEESIKGYIDDIDWGLYMDYFIESLLNPGATVEEMLEYYGVGDGQSQDGE